MERDLYSILEVDRGATGAEIRKAYRRLARACHPDLHPGEAEAEGRFKRIAAAFEILSDPLRRARYDGLSEGPPERSPETPPPAQPRWDEPEEDWGKYRDIFGDLFGDLFSRTPLDGQEPSPVRGEDLTVGYELDLAGAFRGCRREVEIERPSRCEECSGTGSRGGDTRCPRCQGTGWRVTRGPFSRTSTCLSCGGTGEEISDPCLACGGTGAVGRRATISVEIPAGADEGDLIRVPGQGAPGRSGGASGDLLLQIALEPHPWIKKDGRDLSFTLPITVREAIEGGAVEVPSFGGPLMMKLPPGMQSGKVFRLAGQGFPGEGGAGDLFVELSIQVPPKGAEAVALARELDPLYGGDLRATLTL